MPNRRSSILPKVDQRMALRDRLEAAIAAQAKQTDLLSAVMAQV